MFLSDDVKCRECKKVFCCTNCREKHETKNHNLQPVHTEPNKFVCLICENQQLILYPELGNDVLDHIANNHLPLHCKKCMKMYESLEDLLKFSKCVKPTHLCKVETQENHKLQCENSKMKLMLTVSTQTSPFISKNELSGSVCTPTSQLNMNWNKNDKGTEGSTSHGMSSIKNISIINSASRIQSQEIHKKGKLVRSTSTPMQGSVSSKPKYQSLNSSSCQFSSIYNSGSDSDGTPPVANTMHTDSTDYLKEVEIINRCRKSSIRSNFAVNAVTPLRQVMSNNIQKALAKHGVGVEDRKTFNSIDTSALTSLPLDLRTSPALRRTKSEISKRISDADFYKSTTGNGILFSSRETTKSIVVTKSTSALANSIENNSETFYETCRSVKIITSTELNAIKVDQQEISSAADIVLTPKISGSTNSLKKIINFETPNVPIVDSTSDDVFCTPDCIPTRSYSLEKNQQRSDVRRGSFWSTVSSIMRFTPFGNKKQGLKSFSFIKKCTSLAGSLVKQTHSINDVQTQTLKRKRTLTSDDTTNLLSVIHASHISDENEIPSKRIKCIKGRKPIERMRNNSLK